MLQLTPRQRQILELYDRGLTWKEIATKCDLSVNTIKTYASRIILKCQAGSKCQVVSMRQAAFIWRQEATSTKPESPSIHATE